MASSKSKKTSGRTPEEIYKLPVERGDGIYVLEDGGVLRLSHVEFPDEDFDPDDDETYGMTVCHLYYGGDQAQDVGALYKPGDTVRNIIDNWELYEIVREIDPDHPRYGELEDALYANESTGSTADYDRIKGIFGLDNKKPRSRRSNKRSKISPLFRRI